MTSLREWLGRTLREAADAALEFGLPLRCAGCGEVGGATGVLCAACLARIPRFGEALCARCLIEGREGLECGRHAGDRVFAPWIWDERAAALVHAFKFAARPGVARVLGPVLAAALPREWRRPDVLVPVPLHRARQRERGYNPAALLADALSAEIGTPRISGLIERCRATPPQSRLDPGARRTNVKGAFRVRRADCLRARKVLVVDDVVTTGATLVEVLGSLRAAGAETAAVALTWAP